MSPVGHLVFKTSEVHKMRLVGSTPTSSAKILKYAVHIRAFWIRHSLTQGLYV
jgi:hypothetical protein